MARTAPFRVRCDPATAKGPLCDGTCLVGKQPAQFHYLIACAETGEALAVDPLEWRLCLEAARKRGWEITQILNTHEHTDHTGGNAGLKGGKPTPKVAAHAAAAARIGGVDRGLAKGGHHQGRAHRGARMPRHPGAHAHAHLPAVAHRGAGAVSAATPCFNAGAGNCFNGGDPEKLYDTFVTQLARLPDRRVCSPATSTWHATFEFTLDREPGNPDARRCSSRRAIMTRPPRR